MRSVLLTARVPNCSVEQAYAKLRDFGHYADVAEAVQRVEIDRRDDGVVVSPWEVDFRDGVLEWTEADEFDDAAHTIRFSQLDGDFEEFAGHWLVRTENGDTAVEFSARFDIGIPSLGGIIEPLAERTLVENIDQILRGLLGQDLQIEVVASLA